MNIGIIDIANKALLELGQEKITTVDDTTPNGSIINSCYSLILAKELSLHNWSFAIKRALLPVLTEIPAWGFGLQYQLPADCLKVVQVNDYFNVIINSYAVSDPSPYRIENNRILTNYDAPLKIKYVSSDIDTASYDVNFADALSCKLAYKICKKITQDDNLKQQLLKDYEMSIAEAIKKNAIEQPPVQLLSNEFLVSRL